MLREKYYNWTCKDIIYAIKFFLVYTTFIVVLSFDQIVGIPMGTNCEPFLGGGIVHILFQAKFNTRVYYIRDDFLSISSIFL